MLHATAKRRHRSDSKTFRSGANHRRRHSRSLRLEPLEPRQMLTGTWTALTALAPNTDHAGTMELLSDGTAMVKQGNNWIKLTPDATGSYVNGSWSQLAGENANRLYNATNVLNDGRVFELGAEILNGNLVWDNTGEIYSPITNTWSPIPNFPEPTFGGPTMLLPNGTVLAGSMTGPNTYIYDPAANAWSAGPTKLYGDSSQWETWTKLADGSILSYDLGGTASQEAQRLDVSTMTWVDAGTVPTSLASSRPSIGPALLLPDGRVFQTGGNGNTALYDPSTNTWTAGPVVPGGLGANHSAGAMMPNGHVLFAVSMTPDYSDSSGNYGPAKIYEFDPSAFDPLNPQASLTDVSLNIPGLANWPGYNTRMLMLPSGQVLFNYGLNQLYVYTPDGGPQTAWQPTIASVVANGNHYTLTGTQLNGLSAGASYGSSAEMDSNYPIVELKNGAGRIYFARTSNWSSTGVDTGSTPVSTDFSLPAYLPYGTYSLTVVADGIASAPVSFTGGYTNEADLSVTNTGPATVNEGDNLTYSLTVTNNGPSTATNVVLTDTLDASLKYISATKSQGSVAHSGSVLTFSFGTVGVGQTVTATVTAQAVEDGNLSNAASVASSVPDANPYNNSASATAAVAEPPIVVSAPIQVSGKNQSNVKVATFTHANGVEPASAFVATINWGDNSTSTGTITESGTTYTVKGSHTYSKNGTYTMTTTVVEAGNSPSFAAAGFASVSGSTVGSATPTTAVSGKSGNSASSPSASSSSVARDAIFGGAAGSGASNVTSTSKLDSAGADPAPDINSLDSLFATLDESLSDSPLSGTSAADKPR